MIILAWIGSILLGFCSVPELYSSYKAKSCKLSWGFLLMWFFGELAVLVPVVSHSLGLFLVFNYGLNILIIGALIYYKQKTGAAPVFAAGDRVEAYGNFGTVKKITPNGYIEVQLEQAPGLMLFHKDGKMSQWQKRAILRKV